LGSTNAARKRKKRIENVYLKGSYFELDPEWWSGEGIRDTIGRN